MGIFYIYELLVKFLDIKKRCVTIVCGFSTNLSVTTIFSIDPIEKPVIKVLSERNPQPKIVYDWSTFTGIYRDNYREKKLHLIVEPNI